MRLVSVDGGFLRARTSLLVMTVGWIRLTIQQFNRGKSGRQKRSTSSESLLKKILIVGSKKLRFSASSFWEMLVFEGTPPPPHPAESLDWRGFRKKSLQNLERQGF